MMKKTDSNASLSAILGVTGLFLWTIVFLSFPVLTVALVVILLGIIAEIIAAELGWKTLKRIKNTPTNFNKADKNLALAGYLVGSISLLIAFCYVVYLIEFKSVPK